MTKTANYAALRSMTGFASATGALDPFRWAWDIRSVNGKGLDVRLRVPDWIDGLEAALRPLVTARAKRGNVTVSLRLTREDAGTALSLNDSGLRAVVQNLLAIEAEAMEQGLSLAPSRATDIASLRGIMDSGPTQDDPAPLRAALVSDIATLLDAFDEMRKREGQALHEVLKTQLQDVEALTRQAAVLADARKDEVAATLKRNLARVLDNTDGADADRVAQELALLAVKADVTEEIDRLHAHIGAARDLLGNGGAVGRKLDFLMQEFNREANTLCSKAQNSDLTAAGLDLKALIDQMREQVQNVE
ncbi:MAG: YicC/YloC family endoribonuclease [Pseudomonadota bacterium]